MTKRTFQSFRLLSVRLDDIDEHDLEQEILDSAVRHERKIFAYLNIHAVNEALRDHRLANILDRADVAYCDGEGVRLGARLLGKQISPRIVLTYWGWELCAVCASQGLSVFLLGATTDSSQKAVAELRRRFPGLVIAGSHHGYFEKVGPENDRVVELINSSRPDILFVGFGLPLQEYWIEENAERISAGAILPCGSMIDYMSGLRSVAPAWMTRNGLEWMYRLLQEPRRLWRRYLIGNPLFLVRIIVERLGAGKLP
jgi:N-acetylglucosaminyldiphosphoundecaprenol N-acetyl-beta-D-mannosaminyltransferase